MSDCDYMIVIIINGLLLKPRMWPKDVIVRPYIHVGLVLISIV